MVGDVGMEALWMLCGMVGEDCKKNLLGDRSILEDLSCALECFNLSFIPFCM
jgi:hypothetical protein